MAKFLAPAAALGVALLAASAGLATAAVPTAGGEVHVYEADPSLASPVGNIVLTGAITDHGKDHEGVAGGGTINKLVLSKGSFEVNTVKLDDNPPPPVNGSSCSFADSVSGPTSIVKGSGTRAYKGISGTIKITVTEAGLVPRLKSGKCNDSPSAVPVAGVALVRGSGRVSFR
jgi:hypothetical protein